jgi:ABC-type microcin C transport system duplicated ATPase subunit YejF
MGQNFLIVNHDPLTLLRIAAEFTTALDVMVQAQLLELLKACSAIFLLSFKT